MKLFINLVAVVFLCNIITFAIAQETCALACPVSLGEVLCPNECACCSKSFLFVSSLWQSYRNTPEMPFNHFKLPCWYEPLSHVRWEMCLLPTYVMCITTKTSLESFHCLATPLPCVRECPGPAFPCATLDNACNCCSELKHVFNSYRAKPIESLWSYRTGIKFSEPSVWSCHVVYSSAFLQGRLKLQLADACNKSVCE